jgi:biopolymer transport protein ExbB/TolQ
VIGALDIEGEVIFELAEALRYPVLIVTLVCFLAILVEVGGFVYELARRSRRDFVFLRAAAREAQASIWLRGDRAGAERWLAPVIRSPDMGAVVETTVSETGKPLGETNISKALADFDFRSLKRLERTRLLVRAGPALGLMGTLIPLAPALSGLASGNVDTLTENLRVAFSITVLGILIGAVAFGVSLVRDRLYREDLSDLEYLAGILTTDAPRPAEARATPESGA